MIAEFIISIFMTFLYCFAIFVSIVIIGALIEPPTPRCCCCGAEIKDTNTTSEAVKHE